MALIGRVKWCLGLTSNVERRQSAMNCKIGSLQLPRPKSIPWEKREDIFLRYRLQGRKVYPVAKLYGVARSTVAAIVEEFRAGGFSVAPRARVSKELLGEMQEQHIRQVMRYFGLPVASREEAPASSRSLRLGYSLDTEPRDSEEDAQEAMEQDPFPLEEEAAWHLKGTAAERSIEEVRNAARDFHARRFDLLHDLRLELEAECGLPVREADQSQQAEPHILSALLRQFQRAIGAETVQPNWPTWSVSEDRLRMNDEPVAIGRPEEYQKVRQGVARFVRERLDEFQRRARELERLHRDFGFLSLIVREKLTSVQEGELRRAICPACPYPEMRLELSTLDEEGTA